MDMSKRALEETTITNMWGCVIDAPLGRFTVSKIAVSDGGLMVALGETWGLPLVACNRSWACLYLNTLNTQAVTRAGFLFPLANVETSTSHDLCATASYGGHFFTSCAPS